MKPAQLFIIALSVRDSKRRARARKLLRTVGEAINLDTFEVATDSQGLRGIQAALSVELHPEDSARIYPLCARCQRTTRIHGDGQLASLPVAYIF